MSRLEKLKVSKFTFSRPINWSIIFVYEICNCIAAAGVSLPPWDKDFPNFPNWKFRSWVTFFHGGVTFHYDLYTRLVGGLNRPAQRHAASLEATWALGLLVNIFSIFAKIGLAKQLSQLGLSKRFFTKRLLSKARVHQTVVWAKVKYTNV